MTSDTLQAIAAIVVAGAAVYGVRVWRSQAQYGRIVDTAADVMFRLFELEEAFTHARHPMDRIAADPTDPAVWKKAIRERKAARLNELIAHWNDFVQAVVRIELWKDDFCSADIKGMKDSIFELTLIFPDFIEWEDNERPETPDMEATHREWRRKLYGTPDDDFGKLFKLNVANVKAACKKLVR